MQSLRFIDLFCGLGAFALAAEHNGHKGVFAADIEPKMRDLYETNFGIKPEGDIWNVPNTSIPEHDILFAGFPCPDFSRAGKLAGFASLRGQLIFRIAEIVEHHKPEYVVLENVANLLNVDRGRTFRTIIQKFESLGYRTNFQVLCPTHYGIPHIRPRVFIVCSRSHLPAVPNPAPTKVADFREWLKGDVPDLTPPAPNAVKAINIWKKVFASGATPLKYMYLENYVSESVWKQLPKSYRVVFHPKGFLSATEFADEALIRTARYGLQTFHASCSPTLLHDGPNNIYTRTMEHVSTDLLCRLQSFDASHVKPLSPNDRKKALGNSICVDVAKSVVGMLGQQQPLNRFLTEE